MAKKTKFQQEAEATSTAVALPSVMSALFSKGKVDETKVERLNLPRLLKPDQVPVWTPAAPLVLQGKIHKVCPSPNSSIKGFVLWLITPGGMECTFPVTGVVRSALAPGLKIDDSDDAKEAASTKALGDALDKHVGKTLFLKRTANQDNKKYKREMFMFDVYMANA